jgi:predicted PurR-regulated permease PerM
MAPVVTVTVVVAALYLGKALFVPFALATLIAFLLAPVVHWLERVHIPRVPAVVATVVLASAGIAGLGWVVYGQLDDLASRLPSYRDNIQHKLQGLRGIGPVTKLEAGLADVVPAAAESKPDGTDASATKPTPAPATPDPVTSGKATPPKNAEPLPVTVVPGPRTPSQLFSEYMGPVLEPLGTLGVIFLLVLFFLVYQEDIRNRVIRLASRTQLVRTTQALADVSQRISRYLLMTLVVNAAYGIPVGIGLWLLGVPNALLWGLLAMLLRFIPYLGPWVAAAMPILLSFAISPGWTLTAWVVGLFVVLELISNNLVEPLVYGKQTGLSPVAVVVAAVFWTWLWGTTGLLLAIPLTLILAVIGRYVPHFKFLNILLREEPGLGPHERFYQRLVAGDSEEAATVAEEYLKDHRAEGFYDEVVIPALRSAKHDALEGRLDPESLCFVRESAHTLVEELSDRRGAARSTPPAPDTGGEAGRSRVDRGASPERDGVPATHPHDVRVAFISAGDETDALAGRMLADVLRPDGIELRILSGTALTGELLEAVRRDRPDVVCVGGIPPYAVLRARHLCKRLRAEAATVRVVLALWDLTEDPQLTQERRKVADADRIVTSIATAADAVRALASEAGTSPAREAQRVVP